MFFPFLPPPSPSHTSSSPFCPPSLSSLFSPFAIILIDLYVFRNWSRFKNWRQQRRSQQSSHAASDANVAQNDAKEEGGDVPDGQLCVICLMRRRRAAFVPCGHLICCQLCAISVERQVSPKCPLCRKEIRSSMRIYDC